MWLKIRGFADTLHSHLTKEITVLICTRLNSLINPLSREGSAARLKAISGKLALFIYNRGADYFRSRVHQNSFWWILWFMWLRKKEILLQIKEYERNTEFLIEFAHFIKRRRIQECTREDLKLFYTARIEPLTSLYYRIEHVKYINKFLRAYGVPLVLKMGEVVEFTPNDDIVESMKTISKYDPRPKVKRNNRIVYLKDEKNWSFAEIASEVNLRSKSTVYDIYWREKNKLLEDRSNLPKVDRADYYRDYHEKNKGLRNFNAINRIHLKRCNQKLTDITISSWNQKKEEFDYKCARCGRKEAFQEPMCMDHIIAVKNGGKHTLSNIQPLCMSCNSIKGTEIKQFGLSTG